MAEPTPILCKDYSEAYDRCVREGRALLVKVGEEITEISPSMHYRPVNWEGIHENRKI
jgi:hypothetical protein